MPVPVHERLYKEAAEVHKRKNDPNHNVTCNGEVSNDYFNRGKDSAKDGSKPSWRAWSGAGNSAGKTFEEKPALLTQQSADPEHDKAPSKTSGEVRANFAAGLRSGGPGVQRKESWKPSSSLVGKTFEEKPALLTQSVGPENDKMRSKTSGEVRANFASGLRSGTGSGVQRKES
eukprot:Hpha_TRINITY_DN14980_c1_g1::TRINITY_DN14980_c1_g1_i1::g.142861::m.142861